MCAPGWLKFAAVNKSGRNDSSLFFHGFHRKFFIMSNLLRNPLDHLPITSIVAVTQTAVGCGIGLLLAGKLRRAARKNTALAMLGVGAATLLPVAISIFAKQINRPESERGMRRRLESIRQDAGMPEDADIY